MSNATNQHQPRPDDLLNARVHQLLATDLDATCEACHVSRLLLNSAALWHFLNCMSAAERAEVLGEYVKVLASSGQKK